MRKAIALTLLLAGCASGPVDVIKSDASADYDRGYKHGYVDGKAIGRGEGRSHAIDEIKNDPAFSVTEYELSECRDEVSSLPHEGEIEPIIWWRSRDRNLWLMSECRNRNAAKIPVIYRMIDRVRESE